jgi:hypothetical protein
MTVEDIMGQDRTEQNRTRQDKTGQDRTGQDRTGQDRTGQDRTALEMELQTPMQTINAQISYQVTHCTVLYLLWQDER